MSNEDFNAIKDMMCVFAMINGIVTVICTAVTISLLGKSDKDDDNPPPA